MSKEAQRRKKAVLAYSQEIVDHLSHDEIDKLCIGLLDANMKTKAWAERERRKAEKNQQQEAMVQLQNEAKRLMEKGHSLGELIDLFKDPKELHDIYVNSGLVYPDFPKIVDALNMYREYFGREKDEGMEELEEFMNPKPAFRLFVDMDGTLAKFIPQESTEPLYEKGYFLNLPPNQNVLDAVRYIIWHYSDYVDVYVLSAVLMDSEYAYFEKQEWLSKYLPQLHVGHSIFVPNGKCKKDYIPNLTENDFLLDDYTPNLLEWNDGKGIKLLNGINHSKGTWKGDRVSMEREPYELSRAIVSIVTGEAHIYDENDKLMDFRPQQRFLPAEADPFC